MIKQIIVLILFSSTSYAQYFEPIGTGQGITNGGSGAEVESLCADSANHLLYVLGIYKKADGIVYNGSSVWNGNNYDTLFNFFNIPSGDVRATKWGDTTVITWDTNINLMNGTQFLQNLPGTGGASGNDGTIYSSCILNNELYIGGAFGSAGTTQVNDIAKWNGTTWEDIGGGTTGPDGSYIRCLGTYNDDLIAAGDFDSIGGVTAKNIARWDGTQWHNLGTGLSSTGSLQVNAILNFQNKLYVTGYLTNAGGVTCNGVAVWDGNNWSTPIITNNFQVFALEIYHNKLFFGGFFSIPPHVGSLLSFDGDTFKVYDGHQWIFSMEVFDDYLYVGGNFDSLGSASCTRIARFYEDTIADTVGIFNVTLNNNQLTIYPNPVTSIATIEYQTTREGKSSVTVENCLGQTVSSLQLINNQKQTINMSSFPCGMYFIKCFDGSEQTVMKVVKQ